MKYNYDLDKIKNIVSDSLNFSEVLRKLNIPNKGYNIRTIKRFLIRNNIDFSHFTYEKRINKKNETVSIEDYLENRKPIKSHKLKMKLIESGILEYKCDCCGIREWNGKPIVLQLHHIDGNTLNNNLSNLQLLCPNCHSQTDNFSGKSNRIDKEHKKCAICGSLINERSTFCTKCAAELRIKKSLKALTKEELVKIFLELRNFTKVGKFYGVSDNAIRKKCLKFGLPNTKSDMDEFLNNLIM